MEPGSSEPGDGLVETVDPTGKSLLQWSQVLANPETTADEGTQSAAIRDLQWSQVLANPETSSNPTASSEPAKTLQWSQVLANPETL